jgi:hypothetical protein
MTDPSKQSNPAAAADKKKKKGRIKRIRGFLTGESRKERRERKTKQRAAAGKPALEGLPADDEESVYGVDIDSMSVAGSPNRDSAVGSSLLMEPKSEESEYGDEFVSPRKPECGDEFVSPRKPEYGDEFFSPQKPEYGDEFVSPQKPATPPSLQVILLLMDPKTRRFELLQLEFDSNKALASDVLLQIPLSVTEEQLRKQKYNGVCDRSGLEMIGSMRLSEFCKTNEVILAIPEGMLAKECARLSRPILSDEGVISMVSLVTSYKRILRRHSK